MQKTHSVDHRKLHHFIQQSGIENNYLLFSMQTILPFCTGKFKSTQGNSKELVGITIKTILLYLPGIFL